VGVSKCEDLGIEIWEHAREDVMAEAVELAGRHPGHHPADPFADVVGEGVGRPAEPEADVDREVAYQPPAGDQPGAIGGADEVDARGSLDQGPVEVEERRGTAAREQPAVRPRAFGYPSTLTITASP